LLPSQKYTSGLDFQGQQPSRARFSKTKQTETLTKIWISIFFSSVLQHRRAAHPPAESDGKNGSTPMHEKIQRFLKNLSNFPNDSLSLSPPLSIFLSKSFIENMKHEREQIRLTLVSSQPHYISCTLFWNLNFSNSRLLKPLPTSLPCTLQALPVEPFQKRLRRRDCRGNINNNNEDDHRRRRGEEHSQTGPGGGRKGINLITFVSS